jgi:predicted membrane protein
MKTFKELLKEENNYTQQGVAEVEKIVQEFRKAFGSTTKNGRWTITYRKESWFNELRYGYMIDWADDVDIINTIAQKYGLARRGSATSGRSAIWAKKIGGETVRIDVDLTHQSTRVSTSFAGSMY